MLYKGPPGGEERSLLMEECGPASKPASMLWRKMLVDDDGDAVPRHEEEDDVGVVVG